MAKDDAPIRTDPTMWVWKRECEWTTNGRRCLIRPSAYITGGRQYCSWHHAIALRGSPRVADHFESYCEYVEALQDRHVCDMETHYPATVTFAWVCGERVNATPEHCDRDTCSVRLEQERQTPSRLATPAENKAGFAAIREILGRVGEAPRTARGLPVVDPAIRAGLERKP